MKAAILAVSILSLCMLVGCGGNSGTNPSASSSSNSSSNGTTTNPPASSSSSSSSIASGTTTNTQTVALQNSNVYKYYYSNNTANGKAIYDFEWTETSGNDTIKSSVSGTTKDAKNFYVYINSMMNKDEDCVEYTVVNGTYYIGYTADGTEEKYEYDFKVKQTSDPDTTTIVKPDFAASTVKQDHNATGPDGTTGYISEKVKVNTGVMVVDYVFYFKGGELKYIICNTTLTNELTNESANINAIIKINRLTLGVCDDSKITVPANVQKMSEMMLQTAETMKDYMASSDDNVDQESVTSLIELMDEIIDNCTTTSSITTAKEYKAYFESLKS